MLKNAIVTGSSRGIGAAYARKLGEMGYRVVLNYYAADESAAAAEQEKSERLIKELKASYNVDAMVVPADISKYEECQRLAKTASEYFDGKIDVLVNNAGISNDTAFPKLTYERYMAAISTNFLGAFHMCHLLVPHMAETGGGCVISTSSVGGQMGFPSGADYCASKSALIGMTRALAIEYAQQNIRFNCICPGIIDTDMMSAVPEDLRELNKRKIPMGVMGDVEDISLALEFIIRNKYMTGQCVSPNGGMIML